MNSKTTGAVLQSRRPATAKDVADLAGVARPTVSAVLNGAKSGTMVSDATRARILSAAAELQYRPNLAARTMKSGRSQQVGVLVRNNSRVAQYEMHAHPLAYEFLLGISEGLDEAGYMMSLVRLSDVDPDLHRHNSAFQGHLLDGIIVVSDVPAVLDSRLETLVPHCVWLDSTVWHDENCIRRDEVHTGRLVAQKLIELGYREIVCLQRGPKNVSDTSMNLHYSYHQRWQGIEEACRDAGVQLKQYSVDANTPDDEVTHIISHLKTTVGVIAQEYYTAYRLMRHLIGINKQPGIDFGLACCEGSFTAESLNWTELSHVTFDRFEMGRGAARMMLTLLDNTTDVQSCSPSKLIKGEWYSGRTAQKR